MNRSHLSLAAQLLIAGTNSLARTDFIETSTSVGLLNAHDGNPEPGAGTANEVDDSAREAKGTIVGDNTGSERQQDQTTKTGNAQQGNPSDGAGTGSQQQEQQSNSAPQPDSSTAEVKTESSETGSQDAGGGEQEQQS